jgi:type IV pilus assembly protein PilW
MSRRGMSLVELLISASISLVVIAGLVTATMGMQAMSGKQQQAMMAQQSLRAAEELIGLELQKAGSGIGNARLGLGGVVNRSTITIVTADPFASDSTFEGPQGSYLSMASDSLVIFSGRTSDLVQLSCCPGVGTCSGSCSLRTPTGACTPVTASFTAGSAVVFVNPTLGIACAQQVTSLPVGNLLVSSAGVGSLGAPGVGDPCADASTFWCTSGTFALALDAVSFRVNWKPTVTGGPQRPRLQFDPDGPYGPAPFQDVLWDVERLQVRAMIADLTNPGAFTWFPDVGRPSLDTCTPSTPGCSVPGGTDAKDLALVQGMTSAAALQAQLSRRLRGVEVTLTSRSTAFDRARVERTTGGAFAIDSSGLPRDGFQRRRSVMQVTPRNFVLSEVSP